MKSIFPFRHFQPAFCAGLVEDPILLLRIKPKNGTVLVDCGQLTHLAKRTLKSIVALFISHAHMDHFIGFDTFARNVLISDRVIEIVGPTGIAKRLANRLNGYEWNLVEKFYCSFKIREIERDKVRQYRLNGSEGFKLVYETCTRRIDRVVFEDPFLKVEAEPCDHKIPVLIYKFVEKPVFEIDEQKLIHLRLQKGPWLNQLKEWFYNHAQNGETGPMPKPGSVIPTITEPDSLYDAVKKDTNSYSIGYITDVGFAEDNINTITQLLKGVTLLVCECTYLKENKDKARESFHLCTEDLNRLVQILEPGYLLPMHLSKTYLNRSDEFYQQLALPRNCQLIKLPERITPPPLLPEEMLLTS
jgi:ribonuclease Z